MASVTKTVRNLLFTAIENRRDDFPLADSLLTEFVISDFDLIQTHLPRASLPEITSKPRVTLIGLGSDEELGSRSKMIQLDQPVQVAVQQKIDPTNDHVIDTLTEFYEQLRTSARRLDERGYTWLRNEALKDSSGTPFNYVRLRESHTFEAIFTAYYRHFKQ